MLGFEGEQLELYLSKFKVLRRNIDFHEVEGSFKLPSRAWNSYKSRRLYIQYCVWVWARTYPKGKAHLELTSTQWYSW